MTAETLSVVLDNASDGQSLGVHFAGFTEPMLHPEVAALAKQCVDHPHVSYVQLRSTGEGLTQEKLAALAQLPLEVIWHASPQAKGALMKHLEVVRWLMPESKIHYVGDELEDQSNELAGMGIDVSRGREVTRAGNLREVNPVDYPVTCKKVGRRKMPVVLPDGSCVACCNDYGLTLPIGNLAEHTWSELQYETVRKQQSDPGCGAICFNRCHFAKRSP